MGGAVSTATAGFLLLVARFRSPRSPPTVMRGASGRWKALLVVERTKRRAQVERVMLGGVVCGVCVSCACVVWVWVGWKGRVFRAECRLSFLVVPARRAMAEKGK